MPQRVVPGNEMPFSRLFKDYLNETPQILSFFSKNPFNLDSYFSEYRKEHISRADLYSIVKDFNSSLQLHEKSIEHIEALKDSNTYTVTTGQQIGLFGGYLYTVYKTITTIKLAQDLSIQTGKKVIPIFWIADEDHDFDEANHVVIPKGDSISTLHIERTSETSQQVGRELVPENISELIEEFFVSSGTTDFSEQIKEWLSTDFSSKNNLKTAFLNLLSRVFGKHGLVFFGSDTFETKRVCSPIIQDAIVKKNSIYEALESVSSSLEKEYHRQAGVDYSLLFLNISEGRVKLNVGKSSTKWTAGNQEFTEAELLDKAKKNPSEFSPNVFFRPILQEYMLPNLAYVAGPGEVAYYAQMKKLYEVFDLEMPAIVPRFTATLIDKPFQRYWDEMPIELQGYFKRIEDVEKEVVFQQQPFDVDQFFKKWENHVKDSSQEYKQIISELDGSLEQTVDRLIVSYTNELDKVKGKVIKSIKQKDETLMQRIRKIQASVYPQNNLQERVFGFIHYLNKYGPTCFDSFIEDEKGAVSKEHHIIFIG